MQQQRLLQQEQEQQQRRQIAAELDALRQGQSRGSVEVLQAGDALARMQQALLRLEEDLNDEREKRLALQQDLEDYKAAWEEEPVYENEHSPLATGEEMPRGMQMQNV